MSAFETFNYEEKSDTKHSLTKYMYIISSEVKPGLFGALPCTFSYVIAVATVRIEPAGLFVPCLLNKCLDALILGLSQNFIAVSTTNSEINQMRATTVYLRYDFAADSFLFFCTIFFSSSLISALFFAIRAAFLDLYASPCLEAVCKISKEERATPLPLTIMH